MLTSCWHIFVCGGAGRREEGEVWGKETIIPPSEMDKPLLSPRPPPPLLLLWVGAHNWTFVLCVNSSPAHTFPDCVRPPNRWGLYAEDTHTHTAHKHTHMDTQCVSARDMSHCHARPFSCPINKKKRHSSTMTREGAWGALSSAPARRPYTPESVGFKKNAEHSIMFL